MGKAGAPNKALRLVPEKASRRRGSQGHWWCRPARIASPSVPSLRFNHFAQSKQILRWHARRHRAGAAQNVAAASLRRTQAVRALWRHSSTEPRRGS